MQMPVYGDGTKFLDENGLMDHDVILQTGMGMLENASVDDPRWDGAVIWQHLAAAYGI
jgi:hypothetical protein